MFYLIRLDPKHDELEKLEKALIIFSPVKEHRCHFKSLRNMTLRKEMRPTYQC